VAFLLSAFFAFVNSPYFRVLTWRSNWFKYPTNSLFLLYWI